MVHSSIPGLRCCHVILSTALVHINTSKKPKVVTIKVVTIKTVIMMQLERIRFTKGQWHNT